MQTRTLPTFILIGAMKSGTTSLFRYLEAHPQIRMSSQKEPGFFVTERTWNNGWDWYEGLFGATNGAVAIGEGSTHYTKYPIYDGVAERIAQHLPNVKLIYIMREPVARTISHYWHYVHHLHETRPMMRAIKKDPQYVSFSRYALQLEQYFRYFPRERFHFASFERFKQSPHDVVRECFQFLGVDDTFVPPDLELGKTYNKTPAQVRKTRTLLHRVRWSPWWTRIAPYVPQHLKNVGLRLEFTSIERPRNVPSDVISYLQPLFEDEKERLYEMVGMRFNEWKCEDSALANGR